MLDRLFSILQANKPNLLNKKTSQITLPPPKLSRAGKKCIYSNFAENCKGLNRNPLHLIDFFAAELGQSGNLKEDGSLAMVGKYDTKLIQILLKKYACNYVLCKVCNSSHTELTKENRMTFLVCLDCKSRRTVESVKSKK